MDLAITIIAFLMVCDAAFTLTNLTRMESILKSFFPSMDVKKVAVLEGAVGLVILGIKIVTNTLT